jgi:hypothetical protein
LVGAALQIWHGFDHFPLPLPMLFEKRLWLLLAPQVALPLVDVDNQYITIFALRTLTPPSAGMQPVCDAQKEYQHMTHVECDRSHSAIVL